MDVNAVTTKLATKLFTVRTLVEAGVVTAQRPDRYVRMAKALLAFGPTPAAGYATGNARHPQRTAIIDERGSVSFREVHERSNALAAELRKRGVGEGDGIGIMARNHRGFVEAVVAASKLGCNQLFLNTAFAGPQLVDVVAREQPKVLVLDAEFLHLLEGVDEDILVLVAWTDGDAQGRETLDDLVARGSRADHQAPATRGKAIILTSGTTGTPKGAARQQPKSLDPAAALLSRIPLKARGTTVIAAPLFHSWGFAHFSLGLSLGSTYVLKRKFDPEATLELCRRHKAGALVVVPVMLQRILELPGEVLDRYDLPHLKAVPVSGSALPGPLAVRWMDRFGDNLYNLYGSTEVAWATIATPQDLRAAPGTAGKPPRGTVVRIYDADGNPVAPGTTGRVFVGNEMQFEGYTGGGTKDEIDGLMSSGDVGHFDQGGRLFIDGRDDDMIVSGGENVFPQEVEELISHLEGVAEVAVFGVPDEQYGQRLRAVVVRADGADVDEAKVRGYVKQHLAGYKQPRDVVFIDELPRNATGKVLKRVLKEQAEEEPTSAGQPGG